jgi:hypothetical protein
MQDLPFDITNIDADEVKALDATYLLLRAKFKVSISEDHTFNTGNFDVFSSIEPFNIGGTLLINHPESGCYLHFLKVPLQIDNGRGPAINYYKYQVWASATLRNDFGKMAIRRETIVDKVLDLVHPTELHFKDDPAFSKKFNVVAGDKQKAARSMTKAFRNVVADIGKSDWEIEIVNSSMVIGSTQPVDPKLTVYLAEAAAKFSRVK